MFSLFVLLSLLYALSLLLLLLLLLFYGKIGFGSTTSEAGDTCLLKDCKATAHLKGVFSLIAKPIILILQILSITQPTSIIIIMMISTFIIVIIC